MNKRFLSPFIVAALVCSTAGATELHAPLPGQQGPLRYEFEKIGKNKLGFNFWSMGYQREADKAFLKHGTNPEPYTALIFGKSEFKIAESFLNGRDSDYYTEYRNPYLDATKVAPRASYTDRGLIIGASVAYPVWKDKGHIGIRASIPFRNVRVEKDDEMEHAAIGLQDKVLKGQIRTITPRLNSATVAGVAGGVAGGGGAGAGGAAVDPAQLSLANANTAAAVSGTAIYTPVIAQSTGVGADDAAARVAGAALAKQITNGSAYNLKYISNIKYLEGGIVRRLFDYVRGKAGVTGANNNLKAGDDGHQIGLVLIKPPADLDVPYGNCGALLAKNFVTAAPGLEALDVNNAFQDNPSAATRVVYVEGPNDVQVNLMCPDRDAIGGGGAAIHANVTQAGLNSNMAYATQTDFSDAGIGRARILDSSNVVIAYDLSKIPSDLWITTVHGANNNPTTYSTEAVNFIDTTLLAYKVDLTTFLTQRGYNFQTYEETGLGDTDLDLFYQHNFNDKWTGELYAGVRFPTGQISKYVGNPYKTNLGNGGHFEVKLGGKLGWDLFKHISVKADASYAFVLNATEHRMAAFKNATVKNIGPRADADVDWSYFTGNFDVTLYHPKSHDISTTLGYELYYKTEDKISYKNAKTADHMLGKVWGTADDTPVAVTPAGGVAANGDDFYTYNWDLSNAVARKNTESIAHRGRVEAQYNFSKYLGMFVGGKYTFAGQNTPREGEAYGGFNVKF